MVYLVSMIVRMNNENILHLHEILIIKGHLGAKILGKRPSCSKCTLDNVISNLLVDLPFSGEEMIEDIQIVFEMWEMLYENANGLKKRSGL